MSLSKIKHRVGAATSDRQTQKWYHLVQLELSEKVLIRQVVTIRNYPISWVLAPPGFIDVHSLLIRAAAGKAKKSDWIRADEDPNFICAAKASCDGLVWMSLADFSRYW